MIANLRQMPRRTVSYLKPRLFSLFPRLIALYFFWMFHLHTGFPPVALLTPTAATYLMLSVFFLLIPLARRLKLGRLIEFEAKIEKAKEEVKEIRTDTQRSISTLSTMITAISASMNQNVIVNLPGPEDARSARNDLSDLLTSPLEQREVKEYLDEGDSDVNYALVRLRVDLERQLRRVLGKRLEWQDRPGSTEKFVTARPLFRRLVSEIPQYESMQSSFDYILRVCNAAIHGQRIPESVAYDATEMGLGMLHKLETQNLI